MDINFRDKYLQTNAITDTLLRRFFNGVVSVLPATSIESVLEIGCGEGFSMERLAPHLKNKRITISDVDPELVARARKRNPVGVETAVESIYNLKHQDRSIDCVLVLEVLEHLEDVDQALSEVFRVAKKYVIATVPWEPWWRIANMSRGKYLRYFGNTPGHCNHWSKKSFKKVLQRHGAVEVITSRFPWIITRTTIR